ncbi:MAG: TIGR03943 family protein [Actinomycetota bacterium]|nr:TIGR03943 family protein [Actinomycetota bacterium]
MSKSRLVRALVLALWATFFGYLWASGEMVRYLGPRTYWVVPFGCLTLGAAAVAHLVTLSRGEDASPPSRGDLVGIAALMIPIVAVIAVPRAELGALAVSRKATGAGATAGLVAPPANEGRPPSFIDVHFANESDEYAATLGIREGTRLSLVGFVSEAGERSGEFVLTRFYVSCCAADAIPYSVTVLSSDRVEYPTNTWLTVTGSLESDGDEYRLSADSIETTSQPENPYLY